MRKVVYNCAVSLDGFIEGPNGEFDWCFVDQDYGMKAFMDRIDGILYGRKSYELVLKMGQAFGKEHEHYVFSTTMTEAAENVTLIKDKVSEHVKAIKAAPGKDIWLFGGADLAGSLMNEGLVDELALAVHPIVLGQGKPLFTNVQHRVQYKLESVKPYDTGLIIVNYVLK
jgi:dihydrofolate reductase